MDSHDLAEATTGLASRVNNLAVLATGDDSRTLMEQQDELAELAMAAIKQDLDAESASYKSAMSALNDATQFIGDADKKISNISKGISLVTNAINAVKKVVGA